MRYAYKRRPALIKLSLLILFCLAKDMVMGCTCIPATTAERVQGTDVIIITGKVTGIENVRAVPRQLDSLEKPMRDSSLSEYSFNLHLVTMKVQVTHKGKTATKQVKILTGMGSGDCGYPFSKGESYVVYMHKVDYILLNKKDNRPMPSKGALYTTSICDGTTRRFKEEAILIKKALQTNGVTG